MIDVRMPQLGESVAEGTVSKWLVREGDQVHREQPLLEVATDKADTEIPAPSAGRVARIVAAEGTIVPKEGLLCQIDETAHAADAAPASTPSAPDDERGRTLSSPSTKKLAREAGVDLRGVQGTGEFGRITRDDVMRVVTHPTTEPATADARALSQMIQEGGGLVAAPPEPAPADRAIGEIQPPVPGEGYGAYKAPPYVQRPGDEVIPFTRRRRITADHMVYSKLTAPHVVTVAEVDLHATAKLRDQHKARLKKTGVSLTFLAFVCAATVKALREHRQLNARVLTGAYAVIRDINLGIAVDTPGGLIVPSIKRADELSLIGLARAIDDLAGRARSGKITADDLSGTTFTVSNPGLKGNLFGAAIISQPNVGILRMGEIKKRVVVVTSDGEDTMAIHPVMFLALSYDHRIVDGVLANSFLWRVADLLARAEVDL